MAEVSRPSELPDSNLQNPESIFFHADNIDVNASRRVSLKQIIDAAMKATEDYVQSTRTPWIYVGDVENGAPEFENSFTVNNFEEGLKYKVIDGTTLLVTGIIRHYSMAMTQLTVFTFPEEISSRLKTPQYSPARASNSSGTGIYTSIENGQFKVTSQSSSTYWVMCCHIAELTKEA